MNRGASVNEMSTQIQTPASEQRTTSTWEADPAHSSVEFSVRHMMISTVTGRFKSFRTSIDLDEASVGNSRVLAEIDGASVDTGIADRDNHLRSADFFDVVNHPTIRFRSTGIEPADDESGKIQGELTIRGVTRPVTLEASFLGEVRDPWGNRRRGFTAQATLNRKDFGVNWNQVLDTGGVLVGDKIKVTLNIEAVRKAPA